ncbi:ATP-dependent DNA helicase PIF1 [Artemisia annua]|uniref:ATP-dependent DNA helicase PIF1 n=1 Tax=Artemisia annua TaxID=35608 RepID=A0A2U1LNE3_ARTAN|nr:ATP-dependent DNA helicase PIF1 [Artemisia annua]
MNRKKRILKPNQSHNEDHEGRSNMPSNLGGTFDLQQHHQSTNICSNKVLNQSMLNTKIDDKTRKKGKSIVLDKSLNNEVLSYNDLPYAQLDHSVPHKQIPYNQNHLSSHVAGTNINMLLNRTPIRASQKISSNSLISNAMINHPPSQVKPYVLNYQPIYIPTPSNVLNHLPNNHINRSPLSDITSGKMSSINQTNQANVSLIAASQNSMQIKKKPGRPRKTYVPMTPSNVCLSVPTTHLHQPPLSDITSSTLSRLNQILSTSNTFESRVMTPSNVVRHVPTTHLQQSPLSDITSSTLSGFNKNVDTSNNVNFGRPRKHKITSSTITSDTIKKPRGRPRKTQQPSEPLIDATYAVHSNLHSSSTQVDASKTKPRSRFKNKTPVQFDIGSPTIRQKTTDTDATTLRKGKAVENIPQIDLSDEGYEDEDGYTERIEGISKDYLDFGDPTEQCDKCGALLWLAESKRGSNNAKDGDAFSICCGRGKVKLPVAKNSPPTLLTNLQLTDTQRYNICLMYIEEKLLSCGKSLKDIVNMPYPNDEFTMEEVEFHQEMLIPDSDDHVGAIIKDTYENWEDNLWDPLYFQDRAILAPTHEQVDKINDRMMSKLQGREKVCYSSDSVSDIDVDFNYDESRPTAGP